MEETIDSAMHRALSGSRPPVSLPECRQRMMKLVSRFGDRNAFLMKCNPGVQTTFASHPETCYFGDYPTLAELNAAYGRTMASQWLLPQIANLSEFSGARDVTEVQQEELSRIIAQEYHWLKITELLLFFYKFKTGCYGRFYGAVDPLAITTALREFIRDRSTAYAKHEQEERERKEAEERRLNQPVSREEWIRLKQEQEKEKEKMAANHQV